MTDQKRTTIGSVVFGPDWRAATATGPTSGNKTFVSEPVYKHELAALIAQLTPKPHGCICPPGSEITCQGLSCPRRGWKTS